MSFQHSFQRRNNTGPWTPEKRLERAARLHVGTIHAGGGQQRVRPFQGMKPGTDRDDWTPAGLKRLRAGKLLPLSRQRDRIPAQLASRGKTGRYKVATSGAWVRNVATGYVEHERRRFRNLDGLASAGTRLDALRRYLRPPGQGRAAPERIAAEAVRRNSAIDCRQDRPLSGRADWQGQQVADEGEDVTPQEQHDRRETLRIALGIPYRGRPEDRGLGWRDCVVIAVGVALGLWAAVRWWIG